MVKHNRKNLILPLVLLSALILKYLIYGFTYFPILDDYIQYGGYPQYGNNAYVLFEIGTIKTRPIASILDVYFWAKIWSFPCVVLLLTVIMQFLSAMFFFKISKLHDVKISPLFFVIYLLSPIGSEASYWLSASSRIVVGVLFSSLAAYLLSLYMKSSDIKPLLLLGFLLTFAISCGLYETVAVFGFVLCALILFFSKSKRAILPAFIISFFLLLSFLYPILAKDIGKMGTRASSFSLLGALSGIDDVILQTAEITKNAVCDILIKGFHSGLIVLFLSGIWGIVYILLCFCVSIIIGRYSCQNTEKINLNPRKSTALLLIGALLFIATLAPNIATDTVWLTYRSFYIPLIGLALIADRLLMMTKKRGVIFVFSAVLSFICIVSSINEYDTYKRVYEADRAMLSSVSEKLGEEILSGEKKAVLFMEKTAEVNQVSLYKDHVKSVFSADWSLTGALRYTLSDMDIKLVTPVLLGEEFVSDDDTVIINGE